ncbi:MAG: UDP-glucose/GDP-mannose dehydrogenase family protein [archaeon]
MNLNMIGTGYVGLVTGACFAENADNHVICTDIDENKIKRLQNGEIPIFEKGLEDLVKAGLERGNLEFTTDIGYAVNNSLINFICVGTPSKDDGSADLQYVESAARDIGRFMNTSDYKIIVDKSTVPLGTSKLVKKWVTEEIKKRTEMYRAFDVVSCPEFLKEGTAVEDFSKPDRVVVGVSSERAEKIMTELFAPLSMNRKPIIMRPQEAELVKYGANGFLAKRIAFVQELARISDEYIHLSGDHIDILRVLEGVCSDSRIGNIFMKPGPGYGGSCFPKDTRELADLADRMNIRLPIIENITLSNDLHKGYLLEKVLNRYNHDLSGKTIGIWGLAFKAKTDDIRESAAIRFMEGLLEEGAEIKCYDPEAMEQTRLIFGDDIFYAQDKYEAAKGTDGLIIATEWNDFKTPDFKRLKEEMKTPIIFDFRNLYGQQGLDDKINRLGFEYHGVGR